MKKFMPLLLCALLLSGCARTAPEKTGLTVFASFYPIYILSRGVAEDVPELTLKCLTQPLDSCPRGYALSAWDGALLATADAVLIGGQGLESFAGALESAQIPTAALIGADSLTVVRAAQPEADEVSHFAGASPWCWLSPDGAADIVDAAAEALIQFDPRYGDQYRANAARMKTGLTALSRDMADTMAGAPIEPVGVLHEGIAYLCGALQVPVAITVEREPGLDFDDEQIAGMIAGLNGAQVRVLLIERQAPEHLTRALADAGFRLALIDTLTAHTEADPETYFEAMRGNARAVAGALAVGDVPVP